MKISAQVVGLGFAHAPTRIDDIRRREPTAAFRSSFIVGYPGETDAQFRTLLDFVREQEFDHVGVFTYSPEPGTRAALMPDQVPERVRRAIYVDSGPLADGASIAPDLPADVIEQPAAEVAEVDALDEQDLDKHLQSVVDKAGPAMGGSAPQKLTPQQIKEATSVVTENGSCDFGAG